MMRRMRNTTPPIAAPIYRPVLFEDDSLDVVGSGVVDAAESELFSEGESVGNTVSDPVDAAADDALDEEEDNVARVVGIMYDGTSLELVDNAAGIENREAVSVVDKRDIVEVGATFIVLVGATKLVESSYDRVLVKGDGAILSLVG